MSDSTEEVVRKAVEGMQNVMLNRLDEMISMRLGGVQESLGQQQKQLASLQIAKINEIKYQESYRFKRKGNEEQFKFNMKVEERFKQAKEAVDCSNEAGLVEAVDEGMKLIKDRQKKIMLADSSEAGWGVV